MEGRILDEEEQAAFCTVEPIPEGEVDGAGDVLLCRDVLHGDELLETADDVVVGEDAALVLALVAVGDEPALVECYHHVGATPVHLGLQRPREGHLQCAGGGLLERRLHRGAPCNLVISSHRLQVKTPHREALAAVRACSSCSHFWRRSITVIVDILAPFSREVAEEWSDVLMAALLFELTMHINMWW